ncbi:hypothetical protein [Salisediminibacterium halotolerans]|uniref:Uncharacterized protein n=1 Tax=Salisediminibacterium halotolerans TaxID=517425 RepID=A0A1H9SUD2_9BACI|nr:hypothetical protein [Salisediminibacterium haloalkalitolerans]SER88600.1 hypothetical protein SAMN05444126_10823 [Salisediminibacterium haloalkalitolerans]
MFSFLFLILSPFFIIALYIFLKFMWRPEAKDEKGKQILTKAYRNALPIFPIGWLIIEGYDRFIQPLSLEIYRDVITMFMWLTFIVLGFSIAVLNKEARQSPSYNIN